MTGQQDSEGHDRENGKKKKRTRLVFRQSFFSRQIRDAAA
jgi:hypothetical protein